MPDEFNENLVRNPNYSDSLRSDSLRSDSLRGDGMMRVTDPEDGDPSLKAYNVGMDLIKSSCLGSVDETELARVIVSSPGSRDYEMYGRMCLRMVGLFLMRENYCGYFGKIVDDMAGCATERLIRYGSKFNPARAKGKNPAMNYCYMLIDQGFRKMLQRRNNRKAVLKESCMKESTDTVPDYEIEQFDKEAGL